MEHRWFYSGARSCRRGTCGLPPPVKLERRHIIFTVLMRRKTQPKKIWQSWLGGTTADILPKSGELGVK